MTLDEARQIHLKHMAARGLSPVTLSIARYGLNKFFRFLKTIDVETAEELTRDHVALYGAWLSRRARTPGGRPLGVTTRALLTNAVRGYCRCLYARGILLIDPGAELPPLSFAHRLPDILTKKEMEEILALPDTGTAEGIRDRALLEVVYATGIRRGEAAGLSVYDVDLTEGLLWVRNGKGGKDRRLPLTRSACEWLARYLREARPRRMKRTAAHAPDDVALWRGLGSRPMKRRTLGDKVWSYVKAVRPGVRAGCHALRHAFATHMMAGGARLRLIQEALGHADIRTTEIYTHVKPFDLKEMHRLHHPRG